MSQIETPRLLLWRHYVDVDEWGREVGWDFEYRQLEAGVVSASAFAFGTSRCIATRGEFSRSFHQAGKPPEGMLTLGLPDQDVAEFRWGGSKAVGGDILNFCLDNGFEGTSPSMFSGFAISFSEDLLSEISERQELDINVSDLARKQAVFSDTHGITRLLRRQLSHVLRDTQVLNSQAAADLFNHGAASRILQFLSGPCQASQPKNLPRRRRATRMALEWIEHHEALPMTVSELCRLTGVSAPTLYRGFQEEIGVGPKRYIQMRRLAGARKELLSGDVCRCVTDIATRWGFWHMGQFSADYRRHFGELPSQTRNRARAPAS